MPLRGENTRGDQCGLAGNREAGGLRRDEAEEQEEAVVEQEIRHECPSLGAASRVDPRLRYRPRAMRVGVPKETAPDERRVAMVPDVVSRLKGLSIAIERGAGVAAGFPDAAYEEAGAELVDDAFSGVDAVAKVGKRPRPK